MKYYIYKGNRPSEGARNLQEALGATMMKSQGSAYRGRPNTMVINWGTTNAEAVRLAALAPTFLNHPEAVANVTNKRTFFRLMKDRCEQHMIPFTEDIEAAVNMARVGGRIYVRTTLNGHSGEGIAMLCNNRDALSQAVQMLVRGGMAEVINVETTMIPANIWGAQLFTAGVTGQRIEYRIHVVNGNVILAQQKKRKTDFEGVTNSVIRNVSSGWIYAVEDVDQSPGYADACEAAKAAVAAMGLDFGAVDVVFRVNPAKAFVLEINTAPGLADEGSAVEAYVKAFKEYV